MLPSTFEDALAKEEKKRRLFKLRLEMAKFLQETIEELGIPGTERAAAVREFGNFFRKIRTTGEQPSTEEFLRISNLLPDGLAFDSLSRPHLMSVCRYMNLNAFGTDNLLRHQIRIKMNSIKKDDKLIMAEGVDSLTANELQAACQHRSIPTDGVSSERLHSELTQWLELHLTHSIPHSLLILSRALSLPDTTANRVQEEKEELALEALKEVAKIKEKAWEKEKRVLQSEQHLLELCKHLNITSSWPAVLDGQGRLRDMKNSIEYILISGKFVYKNRQTTTN
ncbi:hypothetical protein BGX26_006533 [Mortierella sp. AD094]|nr:hypothetical protein BGX26_006533 [Mortierella sp. AD094]